MNKVWQKFGVAAYWVTWPGLWLVLYRSRRTRVLVRSRRKVLVVKPWLGNGKWGLPGGGVHRGESTINALIRETKEETNIKLTKKNTQLVGQRLYMGSGLRFGYTLYSHRMPKERIIKRQNFEIAACEWVNPKDLSKKNANYDVLNALKKKT